MISGNEKGGGRVDIASLIVLGKAVLEEKADPCANMKVGSPAWLACKESQQKRR